MNTLSLQKMKKVLLLVVLVFCNNSYSGEEPEFLVDCQKLDELLLITSTAKKFERVDGVYLIKAEPVRLGKYGFDVSIPMPKYKAVVKVPPPESVLKFITSDLLKGEEKEATLQVYPYEIRYSVRSGLKKILSQEAFDKYKDISIYDFLLMSLGNERDEFDCDGKRGVAMYVTAFMPPFGNSGTRVYHLPEINSLMLVPKKDSFGMVVFLYAKGLDTLVYVSVEASPDALDAFLELVEPADTRRKGTNN